uniref:Restriction of telomere capping protein 4 n=1 Tax=Mycena chlorophos TaxID=658473 RepID=A0ABQ0KW79_MYCCL|nr:predicted protein [Mycena chlorophos]
MSDDPLDSTKLCNSKQCTETIQSARDLAATADFALRTLEQQQGLVCPPAKAPTSAAELCALMGLDAEHFSCVWRLSEAVIRSRTEPSQTWSTLTAPVLHALVVQLQLEISLFSVYSGAWPVAYLVQFVLEETSCRWREDMAAIKQASRLTRLPTLQEEDSGMDDLFTESGMEELFSQPPQTQTQSPPPLPMMKTQPQPPLVIEESDNDEPSGMDDIFLETSQASEKDKLDCIATRRPTRHTRKPERFRTPPRTVFKKEESVDIEMKALDSDARSERRSESPIPIFNCMDCGNDIPAALFGGFIIANMDVQCASCYAPPPPLGPADSYAAHLNWIKDSLVILPAEQAWSDATLWYTARILDYCPRRVGHEFAAEWLSRAVWVDGGSPPTEVFFRAEDDLASFPILLEPANLGKILLPHYKDPSYHSSPVDSADDDDDDNPVPDSRPTWLELARVMGYARTQLVEKSNRKDDFSYFSQRYNGFYRGYEDTPSDRDFFDEDVAIFFSPGMTSLIDGWPLLKFLGHRDLVQWGRDERQATFARIHLWSLAVQHSLGETFDLNNNILHRWVVGNIVEDPVVQLAEDALKAVSKVVLDMLPDLYHLVVEYDYPEVPILVSNGLAPRPPSSPVPNLIVHRTVTLRTIDDLRTLDALPEVRPQPKPVGRAAPKVIQRRAADLQKEEEEKARVGREIGLDTDSVGG